MTFDSPEARALRERFGVKGVPEVLFFMPGGEEVRMARAWFSTGTPCSESSAVMASFCAGVTPVRMMFCEGVRRAAIRWAAMTRRRAVFNWRPGVSWMRPVST